MAVDRNGRSERVKVLLDTNALMMPGQFGIDIYRELECLFGDYEPMTLSDVMGELERITRGHGKDARAARMGMQLCSGRCTILDGETGESVDEKLILTAERTGSYVVTNDRLLRNALLARGIGVISMRKQKRLEIIRS